MKDFFKRLLGLGLPKDALIAPQGTILTLGEDRRGVLHGTARRTNALISGGTSRDRIEKIIIPTLFRGTSTSYVVDDPTGEIFAVRQRHEPSSGLCPAFSGGPVAGMLNVGTTPLLRETLAMTLIPGRGGCAPSPKPL